jgi:hypothetical protein
VLNQKIKRNQFIESFGKYDFVEVELNIAYTYDLTLRYEVILSIRDNVNFYKGKNNTCVKLTISYTGLTEASNGYHVVKIMERLDTMRMVDWVV